ncbi:MAG: hypothetical protein M3Q36_02340 [bacterium]|nr:hypothetical protein [bacterium]
MVEYIMLGAMALVVIMMLVLRTNTAICFLAVCAGSVLLAASGENLSLIASSVTSGYSNSANIVRIALLLTPFFVCVIALRKQTSAALMPLAFIPAICSVMLAMIYVAPLLSDGSQEAIVQTNIWQMLIQYQEPIVGLGLVVSISLIALTTKKPNRDKHSKKGKH